MRSRTFAPLAALALAAVTAPVLAASPAAAEPVACGGLLQVPCATAVVDETQGYPLLMDAFEETTATGGTFTVTTQENLGEASFRCRLIPAGSPVPAWSDCIHVIGAPLTRNTPRATRCKIPFRARCLTRRRSVSGNSSKRTSPCCEVANAVSRPIKSSHVMLP